MYKVTRVFVCVCVGDTTVVVIINTATVIIRVITVIVVPIMRGNQEIKDIHVDY